jgi:hypothetical protein
MWRRPCVLLHRAVVPMELPSARKASAITVCIAEDTHRYNAVINVCMCNVMGKKGGVGGCFSGRTHPCLLWMCVSLPQACKKNGMKETDDPMTCNLFWGKYLKPEEYAQLLPFARLNHFPGYVGVGWTQARAYMPGRSCACRPDACGVNMNHAVACTSQVP